jgi:hypothetical protein
MTVIADVAALPPALYLRESAPVVRQQDEQVTVQRPRIVSGKLTLEADRVHFNPATSLTELRGNVVATYEGARLSSVDAEINHETKQGWFRNTVRLEDELGILTASEIFLDWSDPDTEKVKGHAKNVVLDAYEAHFEAEEISLTGDGGARMEKAWFSTAPGYYKLHLDGVLIRPGEFISAKKAVFELGKGLRVPIPFFRVNLNPRVTGIQTPVPKIDENFKLGYSWSQIVEIGNRATIHMNYRGGQDRIPSTNAQLIYEVAEPRRRSPKTQAEIQLDRLRAPTNARLLPNNPDLERFTDGYFDSVTVETPMQEANDVAKRHLILFAGRSTNVGTNTRIGEEIDFDRPWYVGTQGGGNFGGVSLNAQLRYGAIHERLSVDEHHRAEFLGTALSPEVSLGRNLTFGLRADLGVFTGEGTDFGWLRPMATVVARPSKELTLGLAYFRAQEWGTPLFTSDRLYSKKGLHFRVDLDFKATDISVLLKYDFDRQELYDIEVALEQVMPVITPFFSYRQVPGTFAFGFKLRADNLLRALKSREIVRGGSGN